MLAEDLERVAASWTIGPAALPVRGTPRYAESRGAIDSWFPPEKRQEFYDRFDADARALAELQRKVGWTAAEERVDAACAEEDAALEALVATLPTTVSGAAALASYVAS